jgi:hypothetical membrane protein
MHMLTMVVGGLVLLGAFILAAVMLKRSIADGARAFIWPWLAISLANMLVGVYWAGYSWGVEIPVLVIVFAVPTAAAWYVARRFAPGPA